MLCCGDDDEAYSIDRKISADLRAENRDNAKQKPIKLLLLGMQYTRCSSNVFSCHAGSSDSGKDIIAKQMTILSMSGYTEEEKRNFIPAIRQNILRHLKDIFRGMQALKIELPLEAQVLQCVLS
jgi:hypothetical protein